MSSAVPSQALVFQRLRRRQLWNSLRVLFHGSPLRVLSIVLVGLLIGGFLFGVALEGFIFLNRNQIPFAGSTIGIVFDFLFLTLAVLLVFSSGILLYGSLFASAESAFLLCTPAAADQVFAYKFQGAVAFSSWAFLLLGGPVLVAYGIAYGVPWYFYALLPLFFLGFVLLPGSVGALICLLVVSFMPQKRKHVLILLGVVLLMIAGFCVYRFNRAMHVDIFDRNLAQELYSQIAFARGPLTPSHWMTRGLQAAARGDLDEVGYRLALIWSNGLMAYLAAAWVAARGYRRGFDRLASGGALRRRYGGGWLDRIFTSLVGFLDPQTRLLIVKDFRTFRRDPVQWAQIVIFAGLLLLYYVNSRYFAVEEFSRPYQNGISLLNLTSVGLLMCAYTGRFIYPLLSLEGRKFWILGLLPMRRERLLWGKFAFALVGTLLVSEVLIVLSDAAIGMPRQLIGIHALTVCVLAFGFSGLSVGIGAWMPNFRETDASRIAIGFGGTMNLVACLLLLVLAIGLMALPWHATAFLSVQEDPLAVSIDGLMFGGVALGLVVGAMAVLVPLTLGGRNLRRMEF